MSVECMDRVFRYSKTTKPAERLVLLAIANYANADGTGAYPSIQTLAREAGGVSDRYVKEIIRNLEKLGELIVETGGGNASNRYTVNVWPPKQVNQESPVNLDTPMNQSSPVNQESPVEVNHSSLPHEPEFTPPMNHSSPDPSYKTTHPTGVAAQPEQSFSEQIREIQTRLEQAKPNERQPILVEAHELCFGKNGSTPTYSYIGKVAREVGGAGMLVKYMVDLVARPPVGDKLAYISQTHKAKKQGKTYTNGVSPPVNWQKAFEEQDVPDYIRDMQTGGKPVVSETNL